MDEAARCSRVGFLSNGRLLTEGPPAALTAQLDGRLLELMAEPRAAARRLCLEDPDIEDAAMFGDRLHLRVRQTAGPLARLPGALAKAGVIVNSLRPIRPSLEDAFIALLQQTEGRHG
jgi:ABC-2 type transport system ATP-binding protein